MNSYHGYTLRVCLSPIQIEKLLGPKKLIHVFLLFQPALFVSVCPKVLDKQGLSQVIVLYTIVLNKILNKSFTYLFQDCLRKQQHYSTDLQCTVYC